MSSDSELRGTWRAGRPASAEALEALEATYAGLPAAYLARLLAEDGAEGSLSIEPGWIQLWSAADIAAHNARYHVTEFLPGFFGFASNGGGELIAFNTRSLPWRICMVPFIPMEEAEAVEIAPDFETFATHFGKRLPQASK